MKKDMYKSFQDLGESTFGRDFSADAWAYHMPEILGGYFEKAMTTGGLINPSLANSPIDGSLGPLRLENLDAVMTSVLIDRDDFVLFQWLNRQLVTQNFYQWNRRTRYGSIRGIPAFAEGGAPTGSTAQFERHNAFVKYLGVRRGVTQQAITMGNRGGMMINPVTEENMDGTMELLTKIEKNLVWGDSAIHDEAGNEVNYDGILKQMQSSAFASTHIIDWRDTLNFTLFDDIAEGLRTDGKLRSFKDVQAFMTPNSLKQLTELVRLNPRYVFESGSAGNAGKGTYDYAARVSGHQTQFGYIPFENSILLDPVDNGHPPAAADSFAPNAPGSVSGSNGAQSGSLFSSAATPVYYVTAFNSNGESLPTASATVNLNAGDGVTLTITRSTSSACVGYRIYRDDNGTGAATAGYIATVAQPASGNATYLDLNAWLPNTDICLILERDERDLTIAQLSPLIKWPLAVVNTTVEFLLLLYHVPVVKAPERQFIIKNIKRVTEY